MSPQALVGLLNEYLTEMTTIVMEQGGIIDKYVGDAIMAEFGAPLPIPQHADLAVRTALRMQRRMAELAPNGSSKACRNCTVVWASIPGPWSLGTSVPSRSSATQ